VRAAADIPLPFLPSENKICCFKQQRQKITFKKNPDHGFFTFQRE
jgi:hypothetical protein